MMKIRREEEVKKVGRTIIGLKEVIKEGRSEVEEGKYERNVKVEERKGEKSKRGKGRKKGKNELTLPVSAYIITRTRTHALTFSNTSQIMPPTNICL